METIRKHANKIYFGFFLVVLLLGAYNLFHNLGNTPVEDWDESRHGVSAFEMIQNDNYIVHTYNNEVDYYNLKPPLGMWLIALGYRLFGFTVFGLRFSSALSALLTILLIMIASRKYIGSAASIIAGLCLATTYVYIFIHAGRTGDFDATLTLFTTAFLLCLFKAREDHRYLYAAGLVLSAAILLKSFATFQMFATAFVYLLATKDLFKNKVKHYLITAAIVVVPIAVWVITRMQYDGLAYFKEMIITDALNRSSGTIEGHAGSLMFYVKYLLTYHVWVYAFIALTLMFIPIMKIKKDAFIILCVVGFAAPFLLFTIMQTRLYWYINPAYPFMALLIGIMLTKLLTSPIHIIAKSVSVLVFITCLYVSQVNNLEKMNAITPYLPQGIIKQWNPPQGVMLYAAAWDQSQLFTSKVLYRLNIGTVSNKEEFVVSKQGFILLRANEKDFVKANNLTIAAESPEWIIAQK